MRNGQSTSTEKGRKNSLEGKKGRREGGREGGREGHTSESGRPKSPRPERPPKLPKSDDCCCCCRSCCAPYACGYWRRKGEREGGREEEKVSERTKSINETRTG